MSLGPRELGGGRQWPSCRRWHFGATAVLWALEVIRLQGKPSETTGPEVRPSDKALEQGPPTFLLGTLSELFPQDGCVEGRWPEAGSGSRTGGHTPQEESERALTDAHGSGLLPIILYVT